MYATTSFVIIGDSAHFFSNIFFYIGTLELKFYKNVENCDHTKALQIYLKEVFSGF